MSKIDIKDMSGKSQGSIELADSVFAIEPNMDAMHQVVRSQLAARRQGTHDTKTRGMVSGGGKKPFRQKGTGRARQGSIRAPHYTGGGTVFGPHPRSYAFKVNNKVVKLAMRSALSAKLADGELVVVDAFKFDAPSTKEAAKLLDALGITGRVTVVIPDDDVNAYKSFRNLPKVRIIGASEANTYDFIDNAVLLMCSDAVKYVEEVLQ